jgi:adenosylcobinamide-GDP ribazoletransferase
MKNEFDIFLSSVMFLTRLPVPKRIHHGGDLLGRSAKYFPWVGIIVGSIAGIVYLASAEVFSKSISVFLSMLVSIFLTGAFHEDGFADVCDGFGGGWTKDNILRIMKDSRLGTYGVIGLLSGLMLKYLFLLEISLLFPEWTIFTLMVAGHSVSRFAAVTMIQQYEYVTDPVVSKSKSIVWRKLDLKEMLIALAAVIVPFFFLDVRFVASLILVLTSRIYLGHYFKKWINGYTGDCLGATQQVCEVCFYIGSVLIWRFI